MAAEKKGEAAYLEFQSKSLERGEKTFFERLHKMKLKTFDNACEPYRSYSNREQVLISDNKLFGQMLLVASSRNLNMKNILEHPASAMVLGQQ